MEYGKLYACLQLAQGLIGKVSMYTVFSFSVQKSDVTIIKII